MQAVTYDTIIEFANPELKLFPRHDGIRDHSCGYGANVVETAEHCSTVQASYGAGEVLTPSAALRDRGISGRTGR